MSYRHLTDEEFLRILDNADSLSDEQKREAIREASERLRDAKKG